MTDYIPVNAGSGMAKKLHQFCAYLFVIAVSATVAILVYAKMQPGQSDTPVLLTPIYNSTQCTKSSFVNSNQSLELQLALNATNIQLSYNTKLLHRVFDRLRAGQPIVVGFVGGSNTVCYSCAEGPYVTAYAQQFMDWLGMRFPVTQSRVFPLRGGNTMTRTSHLGDNQGRGGTWSSYFSSCLGQIFPGNIMPIPDLIIVEQSVNDIELDKIPVNEAHQITERLMRSAMKLGAAILYLDLSVITYRANMNDVAAIRATTTVDDFSDFSRPGTNYYEIPRATVLPLFQNMVHRELLQQFFADNLHINTLGQSVAVAALIHLVTQQMDFQLQLIGRRTSYAQQLELPLHVDDDHTRYTCRVDTYSYRFNPEYPWMWYPPHVDTSQTNWFQVTLPQGRVWTSNGIGSTLTFAFDVDTAAVILMILPSANQCTITYRSTSAELGQESTSNTLPRQANPAVMFEMQKLTFPNPIAQLQLTVSSAGTNFQLFGYITLSDES